MNPWVHKMVMICFAVSGRISGRKACSDFINDRMARVRRDGKPLSLHFFEPELQHITGMFMCFFKRFTKSEATWK